MQCPRCKYHNTEKSNPCPLCGYEWEPRHDWRAFIIVVLIVVVVTFIVVLSGHFR